MNVYDQMNQVCEAIRDSHEYKNDAGGQTETRGR